MTPQRIQRRRTKGWRMPDGAVYVGRPTKWGNPWRVGEVIGVDSDEERYRWVGAPLDHGLAAGLYRAALLAPRFTRNTMTGLDIDVDEVVAELRGRDLACWCPLHLHCDADVLLRIANG